MAPPQAFTRSSGISRSFIEARTWIANASFGLHRTPVSNLLDPAGPTLEPDGTLSIDAESFTPLFAGELPWGAPLSMQLVGDRLFVARQFLGLTIHESDTSTS